MSHAPVAAPPGQRRPVQTGGLPADPQAATANRPGPPAASGAVGGPGMLAELKVSGHVMTLDAGLYCIVHKPALGAAAPGGLPAIRVTLPPNMTGPNDHVSVASFRPDGWLATAGDAALVRVTGAPGQILVTIYQAMGASERHAPNIQVMRLLEPDASMSANSAGTPQAVAAAPVAPAARIPVPAAPAQPASRPPAVMEMVAHIQERGDVGAMFGEWLGERGSKRWIEGFGLSPTRDIAASDIEYQGVLGQGWLSPWVEGGQFCGSRAMALPLLGLRVRLRGEALEKFDVLYAATFTDGSEVGPVANGQPCEADSLASLEAFQVILQPRGEDASETDVGVTVKRTTSRTKAAVARKR